MNVLPDLPPGFRWVAPFAGSHALYRCSDGHYSYDAPTPEGAALWAWIGYQARRSVWQEAA